LDIRNNKPYNNNQEHPGNIYKRYNPDNYIKYDKNKIYQNDKINYLKKLEKYKPKIFVYDNNINNINRNRKLSPLGRKQY